MVDKLLASNSQTYWSVLIRPQQKKSSFFWKEFFRFYYLRLMYKEEETQNYDSARTSNTPFSYTQFFFSWLFSVNYSNVY